MATKTEATPQEKHPPNTSMDDEKEKQPGSPSKSPASRPSPPQKATSVEQLCSLTLAIQHICPVSPSASVAAPCAHQLPAEGHPAAQTKAGRRRSGQPHQPFVREKLEIAACLALWLEPVCAAPIGDALRLWLETETAERLSSALALALCGEAAVCVSLPARPVVGVAFVEADERVPLQKGGRLDAEPLGPPRRPRLAREQVEAAAGLALSQTRQRAALGRGLCLSLRLAESAVVDAWQVARGQVTEVHDHADQQQRQAQAEATEAVRQ